MKILKEAKIINETIEEVEEEGFLARQPGLYGG